MKRNNETPDEETETTSTTTRPAAIHSVDDDDVVAPVEDLISRDVPVGALLAGCADGGASA